MKKFFRKNAPYFKSVLRTFSGFFFLFFIAAIPTYVITENEALRSFFLAIVYVLLGVLAIGALALICMLFWMICGSDLVYFAKQIAKKN